MDEPLRGMRTKKDEQTLLTALLLSAPGPAIISYAAVTSGSATQLADFLRRTSELVATFVSWLVYHKLRKNQRQEADDSLKEADDSLRLERLTNYTVAAAMGLSAIALLTIGIRRLIIYEQSDKTLLGLIIAMLGLMVNTWFWQKYRAMNLKQPDPVIAAQQRLYRGKASVDICVVIALAAVTIAPAAVISQYIDACGSIAVSLYLFYNSVDMLRKLRR